MVLICKDGKIVHNKKLLCKASSVCEKAAEEGLSEVQCSYPVKWVHILTNFAITRYMKGKYKYEAGLLDVSSLR